MNFTAVILEILSKDLKDIIRGMNFLPNMENLGLYYGLWKRQTEVKLRYLRGN